MFILNIFSYAPNIGGVHVQYIFRKIWISLDVIIAKKYSKVQIKREILKEKNIKRLSKKKLSERRNDMRERYNTVGGGAQRVGGE
jgi:hypothetical protein